jgi:hypothetical protein
MKGNNHPDRLTGRIISAMPGECRPEETQTTSTQTPEFTVSDNINYNFLNLNLPSYTNHLTSQTILDRLDSSDSNNNRRDCTIFSYFNQVTADKAQENSGDSVITTNNDEVLKTKNTPDSDEQQRSTSKIGKPITGFYFQRYRGQISVSVRKFGQLKTTQRSRMTFLCIKDCILTRQHRATTC